MPAFSDLRLYDTLEYLLKPESIDTGEDAQGLFSPAFFCRVSLFLKNLLIFDCVISMVRYRNNLTAKRQ